MDGKFQSTNEDLDDPELVITTTNENEVEFKMEPVKNDPV
jgi:hypothetical protein